MWTLFPIPLIYIIDDGVFESKIFFGNPTCDMADKDIILDKCLDFIKNRVPVKLNFGENVERMCHYYVFYYVI